MSWAILVGALLASAPGPIRWLHDETQAIVESRRSGKPLLIDFRADWCAACKMLEADTWSDPAVRLEADKFVPLQLDLSVESELTAAIMARYKVVALPTVLLGAERIQGFVRADEMLRSMHRRRGSSPRSSDVR